MWKLVIQDDEGKTTVVPLIRDEITIGRKEGNTIRLTERNVSRRHARIHRVNGAVTIEDLNSYNGVLLNGTRVQGKASLAESDRVQIGDYLIELKSDRRASATDGTAEIEEPEIAPPTQPMERVDPMGNTPIPALVDAADSNGATRPVAAAQTAEPHAAMPEQPTERQVVPPTGAPGGAVAAMSMADTDPLRRVDAVARARVVVLSSNFAGTEFELSRPASVIGRTDDNDIIINHRSISRHHAKIVHEDERYWIVDLGSSNGVRVNGEEYGKVELRKADIIDLGHVRLRFVEAGEDFVLGRDAQIVDLAAELAAGNRGLVWAMLALLVVGGAAAAYVLTRGQPVPPPTAAERRVQSTPVVEPAPEPEPDDGPAATEPEATVDFGTPAPGSDGVAPAGASGLLDKLALARIARDEERWADMQSAASAALAIDPANAEARQLKAQAERELEDRTRFDGFQDAVAQRDYGKVHSTFEQLGATSVYRLRAQPEHDRVMEQYVDSIATRAAALAQRGKCRDLKVLAARAGAIYAEAASAAQGLVAACERGQQTTRTPERREPPPPPVETPVIELVDEAKQAAKSGNYGLAFRLCEQALEQRPAEVEARTVCVIAACNMDREKSAQRHYARLTDARKRGVYQLCASRGIKLE